MSKLTLSFKGRVLKIFPVLQGEMVIGNSPACTIHIDSLALAEQHAIVSTSQSESHIRDLGSEDGTYVNNTRIQEHKLKDGDIIRVGKHTLTYAFDEVVENAALPEPVVEEIEPEAVAENKGDGNRTAWIQIMNGQNLGKTLSLNRAVTNLGKPGVATAVIARRSEGYFISHLEGDVSPSVTGKNIGGETLKLSDGDVIQIGNIKMQFYYE